MDNLPEDAWRLAYAETAQCECCERRFQRVELKEDETGAYVCEECAADLEAERAAQAEERKQ